MNDDDFDTPGRDSEPDTTLLASAYLDGEASSDERALVETSPDALDEVRRLGDVRSVLGGTAPAASLSEREGHLATALDVWARNTDGERNGESTPRRGVERGADAGASTRKGSKRKRRRGGDGDGFGASQWFLSAAAVLVVVAGGAAVVRGILAEEEVEPTVALDAAEEAPAGVEDNDALEAAEVQGENVGGDAVLSEEQIADEAFDDGGADTGLSDDGVRAEAMEEPMEEEESAAEESASSDVAAAVDVPDDAIQPAPAPEDDLAQLNTPTDLGEFGALVIPAIDDGANSSTDDDAEAAFDSCQERLDVDEIAGFARYQDVAVTVGVDLGAGVVIAYVDDAAFGGNCDVVETAPLPDPDTPDQP